MTEYFVRLEHGRRRNHEDIAVSPEGPMVPAYLEQPYDVSHVHIQVEDFDEHGRLRPDIELEQEARNVAVWMHRDRPGRRTDMVTRAEIVGALV